MAWLGEGQLDTQRRHCSNILISSSSSASSSPSRLPFVCLSVLLLPLDTERSDHRQRGMFSQWWLCCSSTTKQALMLAR